MRSPKLQRNPNWYRYYAGYSHEFVGDVLERLALPAEGIVLDPWNGSGTTTAVAQARGLAGIGIDANPALVVVARGRCLTSVVGGSLMPIARDLVDHARLSCSLQSEEIDPLTNYFDVASARRIRALERAIRSQLVDDASTKPRMVSGMSALAAFYYVALFEVVRGAAAQLRGSNPTWIKATSASKVRADWRLLSRGFLWACRKLRPTIASNMIQPDRVAIQLGDASHLEIEDGHISAVLTSPPYCTRIDYVAATRLELAVLGYSGEEQLTLRKQMLGTPLTHQGIGDIAPVWGQTAARFLGGVAGHPSKASQTYYHRYYSQYFASLAASINEIARVCQFKAPIGIVVQDSNYKELRLDLASVVREMLEMTGRRRLEQFDFPTTSRAAINPRARVYRSDFGVTESLVLSTY